MTVAYQIDPNWADMLLTALCTGFRFGEFSALAPAWLLPATGEVQTHRRFSGRLLLPGTKNGRGEYRTVPVPEPVMQMLCRRAAGKQPDGLLFTTDVGRRWPTSSYWKRWSKLRSALTRQGFERHLTGHGLRHSMISALHNANTGDALVRKVAGHRTTAMTDRYHRITPHGRATVLAVTDRFTTTARL